MGPFEVEIKLKLAAVQIICIAGFLNLCVVRLNKTKWGRIESATLNCKWTRCQDEMFFKIGVELMCESWNENESGSTNELHQGQVKSVCCQFGLITISSLPTLILENGGSKVRIQYVRWQIKWYGNAIQLCKRETC